MFYHNGFPVILNQHHPKHKTRKITTVVRYDAHPVAAWICRRLKIPEYIQAIYSVPDEADPILLGHSFIDGAVQMKLVVGPRTFEKLRATCVVVSH